MAERNAKGQFTKGNKGNPGGQCRDFVLTDDKGQALGPDDYLKLNGHLIFPNLMTIARDRKASPAARVAASRTLLEYWRGKPAPQVVVHTQDDEGEVTETIDISALPKEVILQLVQLSNARKDA